MAFSLSNVFSSLQQAAPNTARSVVGIDVGSSSIKIIELERTDRAPILKTYGSIELGPYANQPAGSLVEPTEDILTKAIVDVMRESGAQAQAGVLSLPLQAGFATVVPIALKEEESLESKIPIEARKYIPVPLNEVILDWAALPPVAPQPVDGQQMVLLIALQNDAVSMYSSVLQTVGLAAQPMELQPFSLDRAMPAQVPGITVIIDIGAQVSKLFIFQDGSLMKLYRLSGGGHAITKKLASLHELDFISAEQLKRNAATAPQEIQADIKRVTAAVLDAPLQEFRRIIAEYETSTEATVGKVILAGGVTSPPDTQRYIADTLQHACEPMFPFAQIGYPAFMEDTLKQIGPIFAASLGGAIRLIEN